MRKRNETKRVVLAHLARSGWQTPEEIARAAGWQQHERMYSRLKLFWKWGLLWRRTEPRVEYSLTEKGVARLAWLRRQRG